jgi:methylthioribose-1-phosphate isomerase
VADARACFAETTEETVPHVTRTIDWVDGAVELVDQTLLPQREVVLRVDDVATLVDAIRRLAVRGAPALGVAGALGVVLAARATDPAEQPEDFRRAVEQVRDARPTAVNLSRGVDLALARAHDGWEAALAAALELRDDEISASWSMSAYGADLVTELVGSPVRAMTICNTGGLAAVERGTALGVIQELHERGDLEEALPLETRPLLQGGRLTTWELRRMDAPHRLLVDSAAPFLLALGRADVVLVGADRIARDGSTANKIGTFSLALGARHAGVPFVVVAPESTVDPTTGTGEDIVIEDRGPDEVVAVRDTPIAPEGTDAVNPAFDVTPAELITAVVTDRRVVRVDRGETLASVPPGERREPVRR